MASFSGTVWLALAIVAAAGVLGMIHAMATAVRYQMQLHDMRMKVARLRRWYEAQLQTSQKDPEVVCEVEPVEDDVFQAKAA